MNFNDLKNNLNTLNRESRLDEVEKIRNITQVMKENYKYDNDKQAFDLFLSLLDSRIADLKGE